MEIYLCKLPNRKSVQDMQALLSTLAPQRQDRIRKFFHLDDAYRSLIGDLLIQYLFHKKIDSDTCNIKIEKNQFGKPYMKDFPSLHYNVSHAEEWVACAIHHQPVGIDIEKIEPPSLQVAKQFFTKSEYNYILRHNHSELAFYHTWTLKESYVKAVGKGLSIPLQSFQVEMAPGGNIELTDMYTNKPIIEYCCKPYWLSDEYALAVCAKNTPLNSFSDQLKVIEYETLTSNIQSKPINDFSETTPLPHQR